MFPVPLLFPQRYDREAGQGNGVIKDPRPLIVVPLLFPDWLIETHDHLVDGTTERMTVAFRDTHDVVCLETDDDDREKVGLLPDFVRQQHNQYIQEALVAERRSAKQYWIVATRKAA